MALGNKVVVVTGATGGIGDALVRRLAVEPCKLGLIGRNQERLDQLEQAARDAGAEVASGRADVGDRLEVAAAIGQIQEKLGPIEVLVHSAGLGDVDQLEPFDGQMYERLMRVNWLGLINSIEVVLPQMLERGSGHIAAISSLRGYKGLPGLAGYSATKAAVNTFLDGLRVDLRNRGVKVSTICPGFVRTPMTEMKTFPKPWMLEPDDAARRIVQALRREAKVCNFPWQPALLMKISRYMPDWVLDRMAPR